MTFSPGAPMSSLDRMNQLAADALAVIPTSEPSGIGQLWRNNGALTLSVGIPPLFTVHPTSQSINDGAPVTFTATSTNTTSHQWQKNDGAGWNNLIGEAGASITIAAVSYGSDNGDQYRRVAVGPGGTATSNAASLTVLAGAPLSGVSTLAAIGLRYLTPLWSASSRAVVNVEKGFGSGMNQDLYPHTDDKLYTSPGGGGQEASVFAAGSRLLVNTVYNQSLANEAAPGHPTPIIDGSRRCLLDVSTTNNPFLAGTATGTQDPLQHAAERGYELGVSVTSNAGVTVLTMDGSATAHQVYQNNGGSANSLLIDPGNTRFYSSPAIAVAKVLTPAVPSLKISYADQYGNQPTTTDAVHSVHGGVFHANSVATTVNGTSTPLRWLGPAQSISGKAFGIVILSGYVTPQSVRYDSSMVKKLHVISRNAFTASQISLYGPKENQGFKLTNLNTNTGDIKIRCSSGAGRGIEASFAGGAYQLIGTTDQDGYLDSVMNVAAGTGSLILRVAGQTTAAQTVTNIHVGVVIGMYGQSNALGRGDDYTLTTSSRVYSSNNWVSTSALQKSWMAKFGDNFAIAHSSPLILTGNPTGGSYLYFNGAGSIDGRHGHWAYNNPGGITNSDFNSACAHGMLLDQSPNYAIWHQGESEGTWAGSVTATQYKTALINMWTTYQSRTGLTHKLWVMLIGRVASSPNAGVDAIRQGIVSAVTDRPDLFEFGGSLAHLPVEGPLDANQNVHFYTLAQKDSVVAVFTRHALGSGRAHRYSSGSKDVSTATLNFTGGSGSLVPGSTPTIGWSCTDGGGSINVTGVSASGTQIVVTFNRAISGSLVVKWCSHFSGIGATIVDSDSTTPLPPEPFEVTL